MRTAGDLVTMFILSECIVETLKPVVERYRADMASRKVIKNTKHSMLETLKRMPPQDLAALIALAQQKKAA